MTQKQKNPAIQELEQARQAELDQSRESYTGQARALEDNYQAQLAQAESWEKEQSEIQKAQTQQKVEDLQTQQGQAAKAHTQAMSDTYTDYIRNGSSRSVQSEGLAAMGMTDTGYSESLRRDHREAYEREKSRAREAYEQLLAGFQSTMQEAWSLCSASLAKIASETAARQSELERKHLQQLQQLSQKQLSREDAINRRYDGLAEDLAKTLEKEAELAEQKRANEAWLAEQQRQFDQLHGQKDTQDDTQDDKPAQTTPPEAPPVQAPLPKEPEKPGREPDKDSLPDGLTGSQLTRPSTYDPPSGTQDKPEPQPDLNSVLALGYGPISQQTLQQLIRRGEVEQYEENGSLRYRKKATGSRQNSAPASKLALHTRD